MSTTLTLAQRVLAIDDALARVPHAFGGALALAYYAEPRATIDIDLNVFVPADRFADVAAPLAGLGASTEDPATETIVRRDGQVRVVWDRTPIDLFFSYDPFHDAAAASVHTVPFADASIPILAADHLVVCKVIYDRARDWVDIDAMLAAGADLSAAEVLRWVARIAGDEDPRYDRIAAVLTRR
jgi:Nucleotidyl transferase AbiEii toxin, Type IV TA system